MRPIASAMPGAARAGSVVCDLDLFAGPLGLASEAGSLVQLSQAGEAAPLFRVLDDLMTEALEGRHAVQLLGRRCVQIDHRGFSTFRAAEGTAERQP